MKAQRPDDDSVKLVSVNLKVMVYYIFLFSVIGALSVCFQSLSTELTLIFYFVSLL